tara:strand:- start:193 stop:474 length:282 start_codon:yes stop_codon:yes gene_type:complete
MATYNKKFNKMIIDPKVKNGKINRRYILTYEYLATPNNIKSYLVWFLENNRNGKQEIANKILSLLEVYFITINDMNKQEIISIVVDYNNSEKY